MANKVKKTVKSDTVPKMGQLTHVLWSWRGTLASVIICALAFVLQKEDYHPNMNCSSEEPQPPEEGKVVFEDAEDVQYCGPKSNPWNCNDPSKTGPSEIRQYSNSETAARLPSLKAASEALVQDTLPRATTASCRSKISKLAADLDAGNVQWHFSRHPYAYEHCPDYEILMDGAGEEHSLRDYNPPSERLRYSNGTIKKKAKIAFVIQTWAYDPIDLVLDLLSRIASPNHVYLLSTDAKPSPPGHVLRERRNNIERIFKKYNVPREQYVIVDGDDAIDLVYAGASMMDVVLDSWRHLLNSSKLGKIDWDFIINVSPSCYPLQTVDEMSHHLAIEGDVSYVENFHMSTMNYKGRGMYDYYIECSEESCQPPSEKCSGYLFWSRAKQSGLKPASAGFDIFGGSAWYVLRRNFVKYTHDCLFVSGYSSKDEYCKSILDSYKWFRVQVMPEELFLQTWLMNGPFCRKHRGSNVRFVNWKGEVRAKKRPNLDYPIRSPVFVNCKEVDHILQLTQRQLPMYFFVRKIDWGNADARCVRKKLLENLRNRRKHAVDSDETGTIGLHSAQASFTERGYEAWKAIDGRLHTRWASFGAQTHKLWISAQFAERSCTSKICISWERATSKMYSLQIKGDGNIWETIAKDNFTETSKFVTAGRWRCIKFHQRPCGTAIRIKSYKSLQKDWGISIHEIKVYEQ